MIRLAVISDFWVLKKLRLVGIFDSNNSKVFMLINFFLELLFLTDLWWIIGSSKYFVHVDYDNDLVLGCLGILGKDHIYDCVVDRDYRGEGIMRFLIIEAVNNIRSNGFVPKLDCIPRLKSYYEKQGFISYKESNGNIKMRYK